MGLSTQLRDSAAPGSSRGAPNRADAGLPGGAHLPRSGTRAVVRLPVINVANMLERQRSLTAVDKFSQDDGVGATADPLFYRDLIPLARPRPGEQYSFEVDLDACTGCKACVAACHTLNGLDTDEVFRVTGLLRNDAPQARAPQVRAPQARAPQGWAPDLVPEGIVPEDLVPRGFLLQDLPLQGKNAPEAKAAQGKATQGKAAQGKAAPGKAKALHGSALQTVTSSCHHCLDPACMTGCPVLAYDKDPLTGIVRHLDDQCIGCQYCTLMCPYDAPKYNESKGIVRKCDMCSDRLEHGQAPACAEACPSSAIAIRTVLKTELEARLQGGFLPGVADPSQTLPTTRYVSRGGLEHFSPVDELRAEPQHAPASLVLMLTLTQLAAGVAVMSALLRPAEPLSSQLAVVLSAGLGIVASLFHLGRPWLAHRAVLGLRKSWLSREAVALGVFTKLALAAAVLSAFGLLPSISRALALASAGLGLCGVFCSVMVYAVTRRAHWAAARTAMCFGSGTLLLGSMGTLALRVAGASAWGPVEQGLVGVVLATALTQLAYAGISLRAPAAQDASALARRVRSLRGPLRGLTLARYLGLSAAGVLGPLAVLWEPASGPARALTLALCCLVLLAAELCERHLFFAAAPPSRMPGSLK